MTWYVTFYYKHIGTKSFRAVSFEHACKLCHTAHVSLLTKKPHIGVKPLGELR